MKEELRPRCRGYSQLVEAVDLFLKHKDPATKGLSHGKEELEAAGAPLTWHLISVYMPVMTYTKAGACFSLGYRGQPPLLCASWAHRASPCTSAGKGQPHLVQVLPRAGHYTGNTPEHGLVKYEQESEDRHTWESPLASTKGLLPSHSWGGTPKAAGPGKTGWSLIGQSPTGTGRYLPLIGQWPTEAGRYLCLSGQSPTGAGRYLPLIGQWPRGWWVPPPDCLVVPLY